MDISRAKNAAEVIKMTTKLGKSIKKPSLPSKLPGILGEKSETGLPPAIEGSGVVKVLMYIVAGLLLIGLILLGVDQWLTPIFQRAPGGKGYIPIPGNDMSQVYWKDRTKVGNIVIGTPSTATTPMPLSTTVLEGQSSYSITMDVYIADEYSQIDSSGVPFDKRIFFLLGTTPDTPILMAWLDNDMNTVTITSYDTSNNLVENAIIDNVPIHTPFRIGITKSPKVLEAYLNGLLVMTRQIKGNSKIPSSGSIIFSPANIIIDSTNKSQGIKVLNMRTFGYVVEPSEMQGRMSDLILKRLINPPPIVL